MKPLIWIDVETTGLEETRDPVLEIGVALTDANLQIEEQGSFLVKAPQEYLERRLQLNEKVLQMHTKNGLLKEVREAGLPRDEVDDLLFRWITEYRGAGRPLAGSNPEFDRRFLKAQFPKSAKLIHYRSLDLNTLHYFFEFDKDKDAPTPTHRSMDDIMRDIESLRKYRRAIGK